MRDICPASPGAQGLAAVRVLAAHRAALHPAPEPVHGLRERARRTTSPARRTSARTCKMYAGPGRQPRRVHRLGSGRGASRRGRSRRTSRSGAARSPPPATSSSTARWTAGSRRSTRSTGKLLWQFKTGSGIIGQPITLSRARTASSTSRCSSGVGGWAGAIVCGRPRPARRHGRARLRQRDEGPAAAHDEGRHALCLRAALSARRRALALALALAPAAHAPRRRGRGRCASAPIPTTCRSRTRDGRASRTASRASSPTSSARAVAYTWWPQRRGFVRKTLGAGVCDVLIGVPAGFERAADDAAVLPLDATSFVEPRRSRAAARARFDDPRLRALRIGVQLIGDDLADTPPGARARRARRDRQRRRLSASTATAGRAARSSTRVAAATIDVAIVWGPLAGYFAQHAAGPADASPRCAAPAELPHLPFDFDIAMGVRRGDTALRDTARRGRSRGAAPTIDAHPATTTACRASPSDAPRPRGRRTP